jgi:hypothetical protein
MKPRAATRTLPLLAAALVAVLATALTGCSGGDEDAGSQAGGSSDSRSSAEAVDDASLISGDDGPRTTSVQQAPIQQALIKKGNVALRSDDVGKAQFEVQKVVDRYGGQVTEEKTTTDDAGRPAYTRMVLRIPSGRFDQATEALKGIGELESASTSEDDVTTELIDTRTRLRVQQRSIDRITTLFDRAESIRDVMAIEAQLARRQADLESLQRQAAYLTNQTTLSTITVSIDQIPEKAAAKADDSGFVSGVKAGWHGLSATAAALATALGALLPWLIVVAILGPPAYLLVRAVRRRVSSGRSGRTPSAA